MPLQKVKPSGNSFAWRSKKKTFYFILNNKIGITCWVIWWIQQIMLHRWNTFAQLLFESNIYGNFIKKKKERKVILILTMPTFLATRKTCALVWGGDNRFSRFFETRKMGKSGADKRDRRCQNFPRGQICVSVLLDGYSMYPSSVCSVYSSQNA